MQLMLWIAPGYINRHYQGFLAPLYQTKPAQFSQPVLAGHAAQDPKHLYNRHGALSTSPHPSWAKNGHHIPDMLSPSPNRRV